MGKKNSPALLDGSHDDIYQRLYRAESKLSKVIEYLKYKEHDECQRQVLDLINDKYY